MKMPTLLARMLAAALLLTLQPAVVADDRAMIDANTRRALDWLEDSGRHTRKLLKRASGVLVFPDVVEMGFGVGGEFGEGALLVDGETVAYYATAGKKYGMGPDSEYKAEVIVFRNDEALRQFREHRTWRPGEHAEVPVASSGRAALKSEQQLIGFVFSQDGFTSHLPFDGDRITRIER